MKKELILTGLFICFTTSAQALTPREIYKKSGAGVVLIMGSDDGIVGNSGTGSIISPDGHIITNAHVVISEATKAPYKTLQVYLKPEKITGNNSRDLQARYTLTCSKWSDKDELDLALCQIKNPPAQLTTIAFTDPDNVEIGDSVVAIGHPEQGGLWTLTTGTISSVIANFNRISGKDVFQTEASVNRGNSGGPLLDENGNMVGINTMIARTANDGLAITDINFSLKSSVAVNWLKANGVELAYANNSRPLEIPPAPAPTGTPVINNSVVAAASTSTIGTTTVAAAQPQAAGAESIARPVSAEAAPTTTVEDKNTTAPAPAAPTEKVTTKVEAQTTAVITIEVESQDKAAAVAEKMAAEPPVKEVAAPENVTGTKVDPQKARPQILTKKRPYNLDKLRAQMMGELEDMMEEFHQKIQKKW